MSDETQGHGTLTAHAPAILPVDAELREARLYPAGETGGFTIAAGKVYGDRRGRFGDGSSIHTSRVLRTIYEPGGTAVVVTRNSIYRVTSWA